MVWVIKITGSSVVPFQTVRPTGISVEPFQIAHEPTFVGYVTFPVDSKVTFLAVSVAMPVKVGGVTTPEASRTGADASKLATPLFEAVTVPVEAAIGLWATTSEVPVRASVPVAVAASVAAQWAVLQKAIARLSRSRLVLYSWPAMVSEFRHQTLPCWLRKF